jgi:hypothetical protein
MLSNAGEVMSLPSSIVINFKLCIWAEHVERDDRGPKQVLLLLHKKEPTFTATSFISDFPTIMNHLGITQYNDYIDEFFYDGCHGGESDSIEWQDTKETVSIGHKRFHKTEESESADSDKLLHLQTQVNALHNSYPTPDILVTAMYHNESFLKEQNMLDRLRARDQCLGTDNVKAVQEIYNKHSKANLFGMGEHKFIVSSYLSNALLNPHLHWNNIPGYV